MPSFGICERGPDDDLDVVHGLWCERPTVTAAAGEQCLIEAFEVFGADRTELDVAQTGLDVVVDDPRVPFPGRRA